jgi:hypothetical protein
VEFYSESSKKAEAKMVFYRKTRSEPESLKEGNKRQNNIAEDVNVTHT